MRQVILPLALSFAALSAHAQEVQYDLTGTYDNTVPANALVQPGASFLFQFDVPASVPSQGLTQPAFDLVAPITNGFYTMKDPFGDVTAVTTLAGSNYSYADAYGTDINFVTTGGQVELGWNNNTAGFLGSLANPLDASGNYTFKTGDFGTTGINSISFDPTGEVSGIAFSQSGSITGRSLAPAPVPEPSTVGMLAVGMISLAGYGFLFRKRTV